MHKMNKIFSSLILIIILVSCNVAIKQEENNLIKGPLSFKGLQIGSSIEEVCKKLKNSDFSNVYFLDADDIEPYVNLDGYYSSPYETEFASFETEIIDSQNIRCNARGHLSEYKGKITKIEVCVETESENMEPLYIEKYGEPKFSYEDTLQYKLTGYIDRKYVYWDAEKEQRIYIDESSISCIIVYADLEPIKLFYNDIEDVKRKEHDHDQEILNKNKEEREVQDI